MRVLVLSIFIFSVSFSQAFTEWITIKPLEHCLEFKMQYSFQNGKYKVRYTEGPQKPVIETIRSVDDINDLSSIADELVEAGNRFCPLTISLSSDIAAASCDLENAPQHFTQPFVSLSRDVISVIDKEGNNCDDVIPLIEYQEKVSQLSGDDLIKFSSTAHIFKLFTDNDTDKMIDHFYECGGKRGTKKFIQNMILIESKKACIIPAPPGILSVEEAKKITNDIVKDLPNMSLLTLKDKIDGLTKKTVLSFTDYIVDKEIKTILGDDFNTNKFKKKIKSLNNLKSQKDKKILDHIQYVTLVDAPFEAIEHAMPILFNQQLGEMLPKNWSKRKKEKYVHDNVTVKALKEFNKCTAPIKRRVGYPYKGNFKETVSHRKGLMDKYCKENPAQCADQSCGSVKNLFTTRDDITDMKMVQGCVLQASNKAVLPVLSALIRSQKDILGEFFEVTPKITKSLSKKANDKIMKCVDKEVKKKLKSAPSKRFDKDIEILYQVDAGNYVDALKTCAIEGEQLITGDVVTLVFNEMDIVQDEFGVGGPKAVYSGSKIDTGVLKFSKEVVSSTIPACVEKQKQQEKRNPAYTASAISCRPAIEIEAAKRVVLKSIGNMAKEYNIDQKSKYKRDMASFNKCTQKAKAEVLDAYGNKKHKTPILSAEDAETFRERNHSFNNCIKTTVLKSVDSIAEVAIGDVIKEAASKLSDPEYVSKLKPRVKAVAVECFNKKIKAIKSWPKFIEFNDGNGLDKLQKSCEKKATAFALPKIILNEAKGQFEMSKELNVLDGDKGVDNVLKLVSETLQGDYSIPQRIVDIGPEATIRSAYYRHMRKPGATTESFISKIEYTAGQSTIQKIAKDLVLTAVETSKPKYNFDSFKEALTPQCIFEIAHHNKEKIEKIVAESDSNSDAAVDLKAMISDILAGGLKHAKDQGRYNELIKNVKTICSDQNKYKEINNLLASRVGDEFILAEVQNQVTTALESVIVDQCLTDLKEKDITLPNDLKERLCSSKKLTSSDDFKLREKLAQVVSDQEKRSYLSFILGRKNQTIKLVEKKIKNKEEFDKIFNKDKKFLDYLYTNTPKILQGDKDTLDAVTIVALSTLFEDKSDDSFASSMAESQLIAGIGLAGLDIAKAEVKKQTDDLPFLESIFSGTIKSQGNPKLLKNWNYTKIKGYLNWNKIETEKRKSVIQDFYINALVPTAIDSNKVDKDKGMTVMTNIITDLISKDKTPNPDFNIGKGESEDNPRGLTFTDRISNDIKSDITDHIYDQYCINLKCVGDLFESGGDAGPKPKSKARPTLKGIPIEHFRLNAL